MKLTKRQLKRIIKEEKRKLIQEYYGSDIIDIPDTTPHQQGYDDWNAGVDSGSAPEMPEDPEYMRGWEDADLDSRETTRSRYR